MRLDESLAVVGTRCAGVRSVILSGLDGVVVACWADETAPAPDVAAAAWAELCRRASESQRLAELPVPEEISVKTGTDTLVARLVGDEYALFALVGPSGFPGRVRHELRLAAEGLAGEL